ncbi:hypothetical protein Tco_0580750 [Tanacetum coccineum]
MQTVAGDGVAGIKGSHRDLCSDGVRNLPTANWLDCLSAGSITTWEDLTTRFLAQFFLPGRTAKLCNDILIRTIDQWAGGKLCDRNAEESWALLEDLALYDNERWNDPRDFAKPVKAISLPQDVSSTSDRHLTELENQLQRLMEAHLSPTQPTQVNKITSLCEICRSPYDTYVSQSNLEGLVSNFMASQEARLSKFEADFKQQQSEMTNKIDTVLKAITDRLAGSLPSNTVKNPKLNTSLVLSAHSYPTIDPQCSSHPSTSINAIKTCSKEANISQTSQLQPRMGREMQQPEEPEPTFKDEFQDLHLNLPVLEVLAHDPIYNPIMDKYDGQIAVGEGIIRSIFSVKGVDLGEEEAPYWTTLGKRESYKPHPSSDGVGTQILYYVRKDFLNCHFPGECEIARDAEINPFKDVLVFGRMVEFLRAIPINLKSNMWESEYLINNPINWNKPPKTEMEHRMPRLD